MVDVTARLFWYRTKEWWRIMADQLDGVVYADESKETVNVINLLLVGWIVFAILVYIVVTFAMKYFRKRKQTTSTPIKEAEVVVTGADDKIVVEHVSSATECRVEQPKEIPQIIPRLHEVPHCEGDDPQITNWINDVLRWIYDQKVVSPIIDAWLSALNARTRLSSTEHGILVDFKDILHTSSPPHITEAQQHPSSRSDSVVVYSTEIEDVAFEVHVTQFKGKNKIVIPYNLCLKRLAGQVKTECNAEDLSFISRYSERPQVQLSVEGVKNSEIPPEESERLENLVCEIGNDALSSTIVNLRLSCFPDCPRLQYPTFSLESAFENFGEGTEKDKHLLVKIIKASNLGGNQDGECTPYCVVEMDEPPQKFETRPAENTQSPFWDESFTFIVKDDSAEVLFEIYDQGKSPKEESFLGLGIVSVEELLSNPSQRQIIPLQSRPLQDDNVTGALTAEFLFLNQSSPVTETTHLSRSFPVEEDGKMVEKNSRVTAGGTIITTTTIKRTKEDCLTVISKPSPNSNCTEISVAEDIHFSKPNTHLNPHLINGGPNLQKDLHADCSLDPKIVRNKCDDSDTATPPVNLLIEKYEKELGNDSACELLVANCSCSSLGGSTNTNISLNDSFEESFQESPFSATSVVVNGFVECMADMVLENHYLEHKSNVDMIIKMESTEDLSGSTSTLLCSENDIACLHEHGTPEIVICDSLGNFVKLDYNINELGLVNDLVESNDDIRKSTNTVDIEMIGTLPPFEECVEHSSSASKDAEADLTGTALKEIEKHSISPSATSKSTLIIHSVQRDYTPSFKVAKDKCGLWQELQEPDSSISESLEASPASRLSKDSQNSDSVPSSPIQERNGGERSRPKEKQSFMSNVRRRLSFKKNRSKSAENRGESESNFSHASSRSASTDRVHRSPGHRLSPFKGKFLATQYLTIPGSSTRSSLSEASGVSASSSRTYVHENSTLVIETNENGILRRYLIPHTLANRSKWRKRGTKLHIFNDHVFVAKHLSGSVSCQVCKKLLTRRPGKQGYECRGCNLQCHKSCHVKVEEFCSNSSINAMEVEYVQDPRGTPMTV